MVEDAGLIKVDLLGLGMLAVVRECLRLIADAYNIKISLAEIKADDPEVYEMIGQADTVGLFQIESRVQMQTLPRTKPRNLSELAAEIAIIQPGPVQGNMVTPYLRRRQGLEPVGYPHPRLEEILEETLGVVLFQEQILQVATTIAGYTPGAAEILRRELDAKRSEACSGEDASRLRGRICPKRSGGKRCNPDFRLHQGVRRLRILQISRFGVRPSRVPVGMA